MRLASNPFNTSAVLAGVMLLGCGDSNSFGFIPSEPKANLGPVPIELAKLDKNTLEECTAAFEWLAYTTRRDTVSDVPANMSLLYRDVWLTALRKNLNDNVNSAENLKESVFNSQYVLANQQVALEAEVMKCVALTNQSLRDVGIETGFE